MKICCIVLLLLVNTASLVAQPSDVLVFRTESAVHLRWKPVRSVVLGGYHVYRRTGGGEWSRLTAEPLQREHRADEIRRRVGDYKASLFLGLFGITEPGRNADDAAYARVLANPQATALLNVMCLVDHRLGELMGELYADSTAQPGVPAEYRVTALVDGAERELATVAVTPASAADVVPLPAEPEGLPRDREALIVWPRDTAALRRGEIVTYHVYRAGSLLGPYERLTATPLVPAATEGDTSGRQTYADRFLDNGVPYFYYVTAVNAFGFESMRSPVVEVVPQDHRTPRPPSDLAFSMLGSAVRLSWDYTSRVAVAGFEVYRSSERTGEYARVYPPADRLSTVRRWVDGRVQEGREYFYFVRSVGMNGTRSGPSDTLAVLVPDERPPQAPQGLTAVADTGVIRLSWRRSPEPDLLGYEVERASDDRLVMRFLLTGSPLGDTVFVDSLPPVSRTTYGYVVYARDSSYNRSAPSAMVAARLPDIVPPGAPFITRLEQRGDSVLLGWRPGGGGDVQRYRIYRGDGEAPEVRLHAEATGLTWSETAGAARYRYAVSAVDSSGNESARSQVYSLTVVDPPPTAPEAGTVEQRDGALVLRWEPSASGNVAVYLVQRRDAETGRVIDLAELRASQTVFTDVYADGARSLVYRITAFDGRWRQGGTLEIPYTPE